MNKGGLLLLILSAIILIGTTWLNKSWLTIKDFTFSKNEKKIDYYLSDFTLLKTDGNGQMRYRIKGQHLIHQQSTGGSEIFSPLLQTRDSDKTIITLQSDKARQLHKNGEIQLLGKVTVVKESKIKAENFQLETRDLNYNPQTKTLSSKANVSLQSDSGNIEGIGFQSKLDEQELRILSNVQIEFKPAN